LTQHTPSYRLEEVSRLPEPVDNVAIATHRLEAGTRISGDDGSFEVSHTIMEGHRFAVQPISAGEDVLSWGLPFGTATRDIAAGDYVCNPEILEALRVRSLDFALPTAANFKDRMERYHLDPSTFQPGQQVPLSSQPHTFHGYLRPGERGVGTRNNIIILGTTSQTAGYARALEERMHGVADRYANIDRIVAVAHTEGGTPYKPNNLDLLLRTLAGFAVHPNVGAVLAVDYGTETITNEILRAYMEENGYPINDVVHEFLTMRAGFEKELERGEGVVSEWFDTVNATARTEQSAAHLKIVLQCGGSDAFSGISGNPLAAWVVREIIRSGGAANLAETDELIGAEPYVLQNVRDMETAQKYLDMIEHFKARTAWHGQTVDANPSGGNKYRGIYNIVLKSIGAARKRHPDVRLDYAIEYAERMLQPGYYFMDSPGNDLESIAGQVASGGNLIYFITGNGSITNFPFVPTLKVVTTSERYELLSQDMDVNAGAYLDGTPMDELGRQMLDLTIDTASGTPSKGERAGHAQVSIWRDWRQTDGIHLQELLDASQPSGQPLELSGKVESANPAIAISAYQDKSRITTDRVGLIMPTSLCSGQIARMAAMRLNDSGLADVLGLSRFVSLTHTEGCGASGGASEELYTRTMIGYLTHPFVTCGLLLEHGCERTHNDYYREQLRERGIDMNQFGWASVQLDGGIDRVMSRIEDWFRVTLSDHDPWPVEQHGLNALRLGLLCAGSVSDGTAAALTEITAAIVRAGGTVVVPDNASLLSTSTFRNMLSDGDTATTLSYGQAAEVSGLHIMETQTEHWVESVTGLGATGVEQMLATTPDHPAQGHPMIPMIQMGTATYGDDLDLLLDASSDEILILLGALASREYTPRQVAQRNVDFQVTRGLLGVSM
jgi:altronate dehydratase